MSIVALRSVIVSRRESTTCRTVSATSTVCQRYSTRPERDRRKSASMIAESRDTPDWMKWSDSGISWSRIPTGGGGHAERELIAQELLQVAAVAVESLLKPSRLTRGARKSCETL